MNKDEVKELRRKLNLTQLELATLLDTTPTTVSRWECGLSKPTRIYVREMKKLLSK